MNIQSTDQMADLFAGLRDPVKEKRAGCVRDIIRHGDPAVSPLILLLRDPDWRIRYRAAEALGLMHAKQAVPYLIETCSDEKDHVRYMAAKSLGLLRAADAVPVLIGLLTDDHSYSRGIAAEALGLIGDIQGRAGIESAAQNEQDPAIRDRMQKSLAALQ
jgi:HEAT repeat protein